MTIGLKSGENTLTEDIVYATPGLSKWCVANTTLEVATTVGGTFVAVGAASTTGFVLGGALFVRSPDDDAVVVLSNVGTFVTNDTYGEAQQINVVWNTGAAPVPLSGVALNLAISTASTAAESYGINSSVALTSALATDVTGVSGSVTIDDPGEADSVYGLQGYVNNTGTGVVGSAYGAWTGITADPAGVTDGYLFYAGANDATNKWSFYGEAGAGKAEILDGVQTGVLAVVALPTPSAAIQGMRQMVNDATATTFASIVAGGGANIVPVYCDGTNWRIG
jgi:hypothetical protein